MTGSDDPRIAAARRIRRGLLAEADRAAGIDTRLQRPLVDSLPALQAQLAVRHDLPMRVIADMLDEVVPMLELLARVRGIVDLVDEVEFSESGEHEHAVAVIDAIRRTLYPRAQGTHCDECGATLAEYAGPGEARGKLCPSCDAERLYEPEP